MAGYIDGYVLPIKKKDIAAYRRLARMSGPIWREHGALEYRECVGDDLDVKFGLPFPRGIKIKPGETVVFSWIVFKSRAHRDRVNAKVMKDPRLAAMCDPKNMPFDCKRMLCGGFKVLVAA
ncbi:MAG: signal recognition particle [Pedosphaera sp.]|nr:signal recognition particle [Pedosphaera sp.]